MYKEIINNSKITLIGHDNTSHEVLDEILSLYSENYMYEDITNNIKQFVRDIKLRSILSEEIKHHLVLKLDSTNRINLDLLFSEINKYENLNIILLNELYTSVETDSYKFRGGDTLIYHSSLVIKIICNKVSIEKNRYYTPYK